MASQPLLLTDAFGFLCCAAAAAAIRSDHLTEIFTAQVWLKKYLNASQTPQNLIVLASLGCEEIPFFLLLS